MEPHEERIAELRGQIDEIDRQLIELFERRMDVAREIGAVKREHNLGIRNERREMEVKANCRAYLQKRPVPGLRPVYDEVRHGCVPRHTACRRARLRRPLAVRVQES